MGGINLEEMSNEDLESRIALGEETLKGATVTAAANIQRQLDEMNAELASRRSGADEMIEPENPPPSMEEIHSDIVAAGEEPFKVEDFESKKGYRRFIPGKRAGYVATGIVGAAAGAATAAAAAGVPLAHLTKPLQNLTPTQQIAVAAGGVIGAVGAPLLLREIAKIKRNNGNIKDAEKLENTADHVENNADDPNAQAEALKAIDDEQTTDPEVVKQAENSSNVQELEQNMVVS